MSHVKFRSEVAKGPTDKDKHIQKKATLVVVDEAHKLGSGGSQFLEGVRGLGTPSRILLTGTPLNNSLEEMWHLFNVAVPDWLPIRKNLSRCLRIGSAAAPTRKPPSSNESMDGSQRRCTRSLHYQCLLAVIPLFRVQSQRV